MLLSEKITLAVILWACAALLITPEAASDLFVVLVLIGVLIVRELTDTFTTMQLKEKINFFIHLGLLVFIGIVVYKIASILKVV